MPPRKQNCEARPSGTGLKGRVTSRSTPRYPVQSWSNTSDGQSCNSKTELDTLALNEKLRDPLVPFQTAVLHSSVYGEAYCAVHSDNTLRFVPNDRHGTADVLGRGSPQSPRANNRNPILSDPSSSSDAGRIHHCPCPNRYWCSPEHDISVQFPNKGPVREDLDLKLSN